MKRKKMPVGEKLPPLSDFQGIKVAPYQTIPRKKDRIPYKKASISLQKNSKRKTNCKDAGRVVVKNVEEYFSSTSLHGLRYAGDTTISFGERLFWLCSVLCAMGFAVYFINSLFSRFNDSPVIVGINPMPTSLNTIPFPAITICATNQAKKTEAEKILTSGTCGERALLIDYCNLKGNFSEYDQEDLNWEEFQKFLLRVNPSLAETIQVCFWKQQERECQSLFNNALTDDGLCFTFNALPRSLVFRNPRSLALLNLTFPPELDDWNPERGYGVNTTDDTLPWRSSAKFDPFVNAWYPWDPAELETNPLRDVFDRAFYTSTSCYVAAQGPGAHLGLTVVLDAMTKSYYCSSEASVGFKVLLHNPLESPEMANFALLASPGFETRITIAPKIFDAVPALRDVQIRKRRCYFMHEKELKFFRTYTETNCELECLANYTLNSCGCVPFFLPKNRYTKICGRSKDECVKTAKDEMEMSPENGTQCSCLPACFQLGYSAVATYGKLSNTFKIKDEIIKRQSPDYFMTDMAVLHFYFVDAQFTRYTKNVIYGFSEFLSNTGGILGLFLGFSFLSAVEVAYHLSLRIACKCVRSKPKKNNIDVGSTLKHSHTKMMTLKI